MSTFKGTPGPWFKTPFANRGWLILHENIPLCQVKHLSDDEKDEATAKAIAATPLLIEALQEIIPLIEAAHKSAINKAVYIPLEQSLSKSKAALSAALD